MKRKEPPFTQGGFDFGPLVNQPESPRAPSLLCEGAFFSLKTGVKGGGLYRNRDNCGTRCHLALRLAHTLPCPRSSSGFSVVYSIEIRDVFDENDPSGQQAQNDDRQGLA